MSLILDALKRADQERSEHNPALSTPLSHMPTQSRSLPVKRWSIEILLILAIAGYYVYSQYADRLQHIAPKVTEEPATVTTVPLSEQSTAISDKKTVETHQQEPAPVVNKTQGANSTTSAINRLYQQQAQTGVTNTSASKPSDASKPAAQKSPALTKSTTPIEPTPVATEPIDPELAIFHAMPLLAQMPARFQQNVPTIEYSVHVYSEKDGAGFVTLNGRKRKVGDEIAPGLILIKILQDSVVLDYQGTQFRLLSLKSWINFN